MIKFSLSKGIIETINIIDVFCKHISSLNPQNNPRERYFPHFADEGLEIFRRLTLVQKNNSLKQSLEFGQKEKQQKI